uniref:Podocin n=1 Tax=Sinocyclocheilus grahami TaxID=75366 RepID=A0A672NLR4_SINGR
NTCKLKKHQQIKKTSSSKRAANSTNHNGNVSRGPKKSDGPGWDQTYKISRGSNNYFPHCRRQNGGEYERAVIFRLGRIVDKKLKGPGMTKEFYLCCRTFRTVTFDIPAQEVQIITVPKDSVTVSVDGVVYFCVFDPICSVANVSNADHATRLLAQTTLRNVLSTKSQSELLSDRESVSYNMQIALDEATSVWGIKVERVEIKDVKLPIQLQRAMAAEAEAAREAREKVIAAEGEMNASRALKEASLVIAESPSALQL